MKFDIAKAFRRLSELDLKITSGNLNIDVLWFRVMSHEEDWFINRHTHSSYEFHFIASWSCTVVLDDCVFEVEKGEFYLTAPGIFHEQRGAGSGKQVFRIVKEAKGLSVKELIIKSKFEKARELLRETDLSVKQISDLLGFSSEYYFNQFFKREEGYPPGCFRLNTQKPNV